MKTYKFEITETLQKTVAAEAENESEAYKKVNNMYRDGEIVLVSDNFVKSEIDLIEE